MKPTLPDPDDLDRLERQLFQSLAGDEPSKQARRVTAVALGLGTATLTTATVGAGSVGSSIAAKAVPLVLLKWVGIGTLAGAVSLGAVHYTNRPADHGTSHVIAAPAPKSNEKPGAVVPPALQVPAPLTEPSLEPKADPEVASPRAIAPVAEGAPARRPPTRERSSEQAPAPDSHARPTSMLAAEVATLDDARRAITAKDGERALAVLRRYAREFPAPTLSIEATVLRIEALFTDGQSQAGQSLARDFLATQPTSTHATRVRRLLSEHEKP